MRSVHVYPKKSFIVIKMLTPVGNAEFFSFPQGGWRCKNMHCIHENMGIPDRLDTFYNDH